MKKTEVEYSNRSETVSENGRVEIVRELSRVRGTGRTVRNYNQEK